MADAVIEILSNSGHLQVTGTGGIGYGLSATGAISLVNDGQTHPQPMVVGSVSVTGVNPVFAYKANGNICVERVSVSGSTFTFRVRAQSSVAIGLQYWIFDTAAASVKDPTMAGIVAEIRDEYGVVTFDATMAAMRIAEAVEIAKTPAILPEGRFVSLTDTTDIAVPSGKVYAVVQATPAFVFLTHDSGGYSSSPTRPNQQQVDDGSGPGPGTRWREQSLQSYQSTGGYTGGSTIRVGLTRFEQFYQGWQPASSEPFINVYGQARFLIVDVTNFTSAGGISPTIVNVGVNASTRSVSNGGASVISQSTTPAVTASVSGGTAPYSYLWQFVSGNDQVSGAGMYNGQAFSTTTLNQPAGSTRSALFRCRVTDANGFVGYSPDVTFEHVAQAYSVDVTPDPLSLTNIALVTNEPSGYTNDCDFRVWGINQTINLQFTRGNQWDSGGIFTRRLFIYHSVNNGASWTEYFIGAGTQGVANIAVNNGDRIIMRGYFDTSAGRGDSSYTAYITNTTAGASLGSITVGGTVDLDNNYNVVDTTPDTITNWPSINGVVNENDFSWSTSSYGEHYVTGINQPITLRAEVYDYSGNLDALYMDVFTWPPGAAGWTHHGYFAAHTNGPDGLRKFDVGNVVNGTRVAVNPHAITNSGRKSATCRLVLWSITGTGGQFASATQSFVVDNDNNHNVGNGVSPRDWNDFWVYSNNTNGGSSSPNWNQNGAMTIAGLAPGQTATLSLSGYANGDALMGAGFIKNGAYQGDAVVSNHYDSAVQSSYANSVTVQNGDTIAIRASVVGFAADQFTTYTSAYKTLYLTVSASVGGVLDTLQIEGTYTDQWQSGGGGGPIILDPY
ncbi:hypothetical protein ACLBV5_09635 [Brevundimonas sp. M1A4_2e]